MSSNIFLTSEAKKFLADAYRLVHLQHAYTLFHTKFLEHNHPVEILKIKILKPERIVLKRWSKFAAHLDAMQTTFELFGKNLARKEYVIRKKELLKIATQAIFSSKDEGFDNMQVKRLFWMLGIRDFFYPFLFLMMLFLSKGSLRKYLLFGGIYSVFIFHHKKKYLHALRTFFTLEADTSVYQFMINNINKTQSDYFKN